MKLTSSAFAEGEPIPRSNSAEGEDRSPPLDWSGVPAGTKSLAMICDDPDAPMGIWVHWVLYGLPADTASLPGGVPTDETLANGARQGMNDSDGVGYSGPLPPPGKPHRYFFRLYALDIAPALPPRATKAELVEAMSGHILAEGQLMGTYQRKR